MSISLVNVQFNRKSYVLFRTVLFPMNCGDHERLFQHLESSSEQLRRKALHMSLIKSFKTIRSYVWAKVCTATIYRKYCSRLFEVTWYLGNGTQL